jgi:plasmid stabilization system protein ParE
MELAFHPAARVEAREAFLYLAEEDECLADDFEVRLTKALAAIQSRPELCRVRRYKVRRKNLLRFKRHYIAYMIWNGQIVIIAIGHGSRPPYYWYRRPKEFRENRA